MYGLFKITFDYYSWTDLVCVSAVRENLEHYYRDEVKAHPFAEKAPLYDKKKSDEIKEGRSEEFHFVILELEEV